MQAAGLIGQGFARNLPGRVSEWLGSRSARDTRQRREAEQEHGSLAKDKEVEDRRGETKRRRDRRGRQRREEARGQCVSGDEEEDEEEHRSRRETKERTTMRRTEAGTKKW